MSPEQREQAVDNALSDFVAAMADPVTSDIRGMEGDFVILADGQEMAMHFTMEFGSNDVMYVLVMSEGGDMMFMGDAEMWCTPDEMVVRAQGQTFSMAMEEGCFQGFDQMDFAQDMPDLEGNISALPDGRIQAVSIEDGTTFKLIISTDGRVDEVHIDGPEMQGQVEVLYGARKVIDVPEAEPMDLGAFGAM